MTLITLRDVVFAGVNPRIIGPIFASLMIGSMIILNRAGIVHRSRLRDVLAEASFTIYLTHYFVTQTAVKIVERFDLREPALLIPLLIGTYVGVAILGVLATRLVEAPLETFVRNAWSKRAQASHVTPAKAN